MVIWEVPTVNLWYLIVWWSFMIEGHSPLFRVKLIATKINFNFTGWNMACIFTILCTKWEVSSYWKCQRRHKRCISHIQILFTSSYSHELLNKRQIFFWCNIFQINGAVQTNASEFQWINLGIHTEACMTRPETCGAAGGAISLWFRVIDCSISSIDSGAVVSTLTDSLETTGIAVECSATNTRYIWSNLNIHVYPIWCWSCLIRWTLEKPFFLNSLMSN